MIHPKPVAQSIVTKLVLLNIIILIAFAGVILVNAALIRQTKYMFVSFVDDGVDRVVANEHLSRSLNQVSNDIQQLVSAFPSERSKLNDERVRLEKELTRIVELGAQDAAVAPHLNRFASSFGELLARCGEVDGLMSGMDQTEQTLNGQFDRIEDTIAERIVGYKLDNKEYKISSIEQVLSLLPDLRYRLLNIRLLLAESERAHLKSRKPEADYENRILDMISEMEASIPSVTNAGVDLDPLGDSALASVKQLKRQVRVLHQDLRGMQANLESLQQNQRLVVSTIEASGREIFAKTAQMREGMVGNLRSYGMIMGGMSLLVIAVTVFVGAYGVRIARPIQRLTRSVSAIAAGDLDLEIKPEGQGEVAILSRSFLAMRDAVREKINALALQNEAMAREISLRRITEDALRQSEKKYRTLLENLPQKIFYKDQQLIFRSCNAAFAGDLNLTPEEVAGKTDYDFYPAWLAERYTADDRRILETGVAEEIEEPYSCDDFTGTINTVKTPVRDSAGEIIGILGIFWDITEKKRIEEDLRKYERIIATSQDAMSILDTNFVYEAVNDAFADLFGVSRADIVGRSAREIFSEDGFNILRSQLEKCLTGVSVNFKAWFNSPAVGKIYMDVACYPHFEGGNKVSGIVSNARNITETKVMEEQLNQVQKMEAIGTLAGGISHDFNNILSGILGYTELLLSEVAEGGKEQKWAGHILTGAQRAKNLVRQILTFSRRSEQIVQPVKIEPIIDEVVALIRASIPVTVEIIKEVHKTSGAVMADSTQLHQVLINLCSNSAHAMKDTGGVLTVGLEEMTPTAELRTRYPELGTGKYFKIVVKDTGQGISPEHLDRIFEPYFTTKEKGVGTGLGLATVHGIIKSYAGVIDVASTPGAGTAITIFLPGIEMVEVNLPADTGITAVLGQGKVLLVDDEEMLRDVGQEMLSRLGYLVETAGSAGAALDIFAKDPRGFDLVFTDQTMPKMTGQELAVQIKKIRADIPVILCTGFSDLIDEDNARAMGIDGYLKKPIGTRELSEALQKVMAG